MKNNGDYFHNGASFVQQVTLWGARLQSTDRAEPYRLLLELATRLDEAKDRRLLLECESVLRRSLTHGLLRAESEQLVRDIIEATSPRRPPLPEGNIIKALAAARVVLDNPSTEEAKRSALEIIAEALS